METSIEFTLTDEAIAAVRLRAPHVPVAAFRVQVPAARAPVPGDMVQLAGVPRDLFLFARTRIWRLMPDAAELHIVLGLGMDTLEMDSMRP